MAAAQSFSIGTVRRPNDGAETIKLFEAYAESLDIDLSFQGFAGEMASFPGTYAPPTGMLLLARRVSGEAVGCVGLRPLVPGDSCEMKRLYVDPKGRGLGIGQALAERIVREARKLGYSTMRLDTLPSMGSARALYERLGFVPIRPYYETPLEGTIFLELAL